jgi:integrase
MKAAGFLCLQGKRSQRNTLELCCIGTAAEGGLSMKTTEPIRDKGHITKLVGYYLAHGQIRNHVLIVMALYTALRISDLLLLRWDDVYDFAAKRIRTRVNLTEKKTGKTKSIKLNANILATLQLFLDTSEPGGFLFANPRTGKALSRSQAYRVIRSAAEAVGLPGHVSPHSLRKTFGYHAWNDSLEPEKIIVVIMRAYNHSSLAITYRYLGITQNDIDALYTDINLMPSA